MGTFCVGVVASAVIACAVSPAANAYDYWSTKDEIAFISPRSGTNDLFRMNANGSGATNLTPSSMATEDAPAFSPNGKKIAYTALGSPDAEIFVASRTGARAHPVTSNDSGDFGAVWAPDGKSLVFTHSSGGGATNLVTLNLETGKQRDLTPRLPGLAKNPSFSPNGKSIAFVGQFSGRSEVYRMRSDGTRLVPVTDTSLTEQSVDWSPNGDTLAVGRSDGGGVISFISAKDGSTVLIPPIGDNAAAPSFSPNGNSLAYSAYDGSDLEIFSIRFDGSSPVNLTNNDAVDYIDD